MLVVIAMLNERAQRERERNVLFNDALNTFYLRLYGVRHMVKDHSDSEHWLEREIAQWVHPLKDRSDDPSHHERTLYLWATSRSPSVLRFRALPTNNFSSPHEDNNIHFHQFYGSLFYIVTINTKCQETKQPIILRAREREREGGGGRRRVSWCLSLSSNLYPLKVKTRCSGPMPQLSGPSKTASWCFSLVFTER